MDEEIEHSMETQVNIVVDELKTIIDKLKKTKDIILIYKFSQTLEDLSKDILEDLHYEDKTKEIRRNLEKLAKKNPKAKDEILEFSKKVFCVHSDEDRVEYIISGSYKYEIRDTNKITISCGYPPCDHSFEKSWYMSINGTEICEEADPYNEDWLECYFNEEDIDMVKKTLKFENVDAMNVIACFMDH